MIAYHLRQAFVPGEITPEEANRLGRELAMRFTKGRNAFIVCTHTDKHHIHNHIIFSAVNTDHDRKFRNFWGSSKALRRLNDTICIENGYSVVEDPARHGKSYNKWLGDQAKPSHREQLAAAIDAALAQKPENFDALLELLRQTGYEIKNADRPNPSLRGGSQKRFIRLDSIGPGYSAADLRAVIAVMRTQIINYAKTRDVYAAYRKAGYSKKFKAEHEADILLHQAAKKYFDEQDLKKLPSVKSLQAEYAELLAKKKAAYADYREARNEMQELVTAKANVERILGKTPEREARTGPEKEQR